MVALRSLVDEDVFGQPVRGFKVDEAFVREWRREAREQALLDAEAWDAQARILEGADE